MNIAVSGLFLLILFLPGIIFRIVVIKSDSFENPLDTSRVAELVFIMIPTLVLHSIGYYVYEHLLQTNVNLEQIYYLLSGSSAAVQQLDFVHIIKPALPGFLGYILLLCFFSAVLSWIFKKIILYCNLDLIKPSIFAISNEWDNILSGRIFLYQRKNDIKEEIRDFIAIKGGKSNLNKEDKQVVKAMKQKIKDLEIDFIAIDVLVNAAGKNTIFKGTLLNYFLAKGNALDKLYLINPFKKEVDAPSNEPFISITSDTLVIKSTHIINLNFRIVWAE